MHQPKSCKQFEWERVFRSFAFQSIVLGATVSFYE